MALLISNGEKMPSRFRGDLREWVYRYLVLRDGDRCAHCGKSRLATCQSKTISKKQKKTGHYLDIHHIDGDKTNNNDDNLQLLCRSCNVKESNRSRKGLPRERVCVCVDARARKNVLGYERGTAEMQANQWYEGAYRDWIMAMVKQEGFLLKEDAIDGGAEITGCSQETARRYLRKLCSIVGPLKEEPDLTRKKIIKLR